MKNGFRQWFGNRNERVFRKDVKEKNFCFFAGNSNKPFFHHSSAWIHICGPEYG